MCAIDRSRALKRWTQSSTEPKVNGVGTPWRRFRSQSQATLNARSSRDPGVSSAITVPVVDEVAERGSHAGVVTQPPGHVARPRPEVQHRLTGVEVGGDPATLLVLAQEHQTCGAAPSADPSPLSSASCSTSQASTAHLMRIGYFTTPFSATRSPNSSSEGSTSPDIIPRKSRIIARASSTRRPATASVIIDAELCEIEHPCPRNVTSARASPSSWTDTVISSPQSGLFFEQVSSAPGSSRLFRGFL